MLLAWLALHPGSHAPRESAGRFWPAEALCRSELLAGVDDELVYAACAEHERRLAELLARLPGAWTRNAVVGDFRSGTGRLSADGLDRRDTPPLAGKPGVPIVLEQTTGLDDLRSSPSSRPSDSRFACVSDSAC